MRAQWLRAKGFTVLKCDNRGSSRRGLAFEATLKGRMGTLEVEDQESAVSWAVAQGLTDPARVGIYGWSYGGWVIESSRKTLPRLDFLASEPAVAIGSQTFFVIVLQVPCSDEPLQGAKHVCVCRRGGASDFLGWL
jgi:alpha/beta superfamily hydrolase